MRFIAGGLHAIVSSVLFPAFLACTATALAQGVSSRQQQAAAIDPGNTEGLTPAAISCMETSEGYTS
jgi:hypothetical protein